MQLVHHDSQANKIYSEAQPWVSSMDASHRAQIYAISAETLRICAILLQPYIPTKSVELLEALGTRLEERTFSHAEPGKGAVGDFKQGLKIFIDPDPWGKGHSRRVSSPSTSE